MVRHPRLENVAPCGMQVQVLSPSSLYKPCKGARSSNGRIPDLHSGGFRFESGRVQVEAQAEQDRANMPIILALVAQCRASVS